MNLDELEGRRALAHRVADRAAAAAAVAVVAVVAAVIVWGWVRGY